MILYRRACENDLESIMKLLKRTFSLEQGIPEEMNALPQDKKPQWFCAAENETVIGTIAFFQETDGWHAGRFAVEPSYRGRHIGTELLIFALREMFMSGADEIKMDGRPATARIMTRLGAEIAGKEYMFYNSTCIPLRLAKDDFVGDPEVINEAIDYVHNMFHDNYGGHDAQHTMRVYRCAMQIAKEEKGCCKEIVALSALLHDVDDHKLFHTVNNANARAFLQSHGIDSTETEIICTVINAVSFSQNRGKQPGSLEGKIVQDADRLDAIGAIGIARTFAFGGEHGRPLEDSIRHFYDKLLLLKNELNTDAARKLAEKRHLYMLSFLDEYFEETGEQPTCTPVSADTF